MLHTKVVTLEVGGQQHTVTITVDMPDLGTESHVDYRMVLAAAAANQNLVYASRHHRDRNVRCIVQPDLVQPAKAPLRLVA